MKNFDWTEKRAVAVLCLLAGLQLAGGLADDALAADPPVRALARAADFVFRGTVEKTGAANLSLVEPTAQTAIVRVDQVLEAGGTLDDFTGRRITVFLREDLSPGEERVFFTSVRLLGESLGVQEVGRSAGAAAEVAAEVERATSDLGREDLAARLAAAELVVSGRVLATRPTYSSPEHGPFTEHNPLWWQAVLEVGSVLKGRVAEKTVTFLYPSSIDIMWVQAPKPSPGDTGTWLLHRYTADDGAAVLFTVDPRDRLTAAEGKLAAGMVER